MGNALNKEKILRYHNEKLDSDCKEDIVLALKVVKDDKFLEFLYSCIFYDVVRIPMEPRFLHLIRSYKIIQYLLMEHFEIEFKEQEYQEFCQKYSAPEVPGGKDVLELLLQLELGAEKIGKVDENFIIEIFEGIEESDYDECLKGEVSPLKVLLCKFLAREKKVISMHDFYAFALTEKMNICTALASCNDLDAHSILSVIGNSSYSAIQKKVKHFYAVYPELKTMDAQLFPERLSYLSDPLSVPLKTKELRTYMRIDIARYADKKLYESLSKSFNLTINEENCNIYFQLIKIIEIFSSEKHRLIKTVVNDIFLENKQLFRLFLCLKISLNTVLIKHLPALMNLYEIVLECAVEKREDYFFDFLGLILETFPQEACIELIIKHKFYLSKKFVEKYNYIIKS